MATTNPRSSPLGLGVWLGMPLTHVNGRAIYSTYLTYDVIHTCTFYEFLRIQWADIMGGFGRKCALKGHFGRPIIKSLVVRSEEV
eukprot:scaffold1241_cov52-Cyclotella_meneghiniana.AAC.1